MLKRGFRNTAVSGVRPLNPKATRMVGPAYTLRYVPGREDLDKPPSPNDPPHAQNKAIEETPEGHVLVIGTEGNLRSGTLGDILALRLEGARRRRRVERRRHARHAGDRQLRFPGLLRRGRGAAQHEPSPSCRSADAGRYLRRGSLSGRCDRGGR